MCSSGHSLDTFHELRTGTGECAGIRVVLSVGWCRVSLWGAHLCRVAGDARVSSSCCVGWDTGTGRWARRWLMPVGRGAGDARIRVYSRHAAGDARVSPGCYIVVRTGTGECADISRLLCWLAYRNLNNAVTVTPARPARPTSPYVCDPRCDTHHTTRPALPGKSPRLAYDRNHGHDYGGVGGAPGQRTAVWRVS